jgi:hypothetical protein
MTLPSQAWIDYEAANDRLREAIAHLDHEVLTYGALSESAKAARARVQRMTDRRDYFRRLWLATQS